MRAFILFCLTLCTSTSASAQPAQPDYAAQLIHKQIYLRGLWDKNKLHFDSAGRLAGGYKTTSPLLALVDLDKIDQKPDRLILRGHRLALTYVDQQPRRATFSEIEIEVSAPANGDYRPALDLIFASSLAGLAPAAPDFWQHFLVGGAATTTPAPVTDTNSPPVARIGGAVTAPRVLKAAEPEYNDVARRFHLNGHVLVALLVEPDGQPSHVEIARPVGLGLDEAAVKAVRAYRFKPATQNGQPVAVPMMVEVNFQLF